MKKLLSSLVLIAVLLSACFIGAMPTSAAEVNYDDFDIYDGIIVEYLGAGGEVIIPTVDAEGNPVTEIDSRAFYGNEDITSVVIPEGIVKIGSEAFEGCTYLEKVSLPFSLTEAGFSTFRSCPAISKIVIPSSLKEIPIDFLSGARALTDITISYGIETIGVFSFCGITASKVVIPKSVTAIHAYAFSNIYSEKMDITISNPLCDLGYQNNYMGTKGYDAVFNSPEHIQTAMTIYVPENSLVKTTLASAPHTASYIRVLPIDQATIDALPENNEDYGMQEPAKPDVDTNTDGDGDTDTDANSGNTDTDNNGGSANSSTPDLMMLLIIIGAVFGGLIFLIIIVVVIVVIVKANKKKKKAAAKAARRAAKAAAEKTEAQSEENINDENE